MSTFTNLVWSAVNMRKDSPSAVEYSRTGTDTASYGPYFSGTRGKVHPDLVYAASLMSGRETHPGSFGVVKIGTENYACEYTGRDGKTAVIHISFLNGKMEGCKLRKNGMPEPFDAITVTDETDTVPIMCCLIADFWDRIEAGSAAYGPGIYDRSSLCTALKTGTKEEYSCALTALSEMLQYETGCEPQILRVALTGDGVMNQITKSGLNPLKSGEPICGKPLVLSCAEDAADPSGSFVPMKSVLALPELRKLREENLRSLPEDMLPFVGGGLSFSGDTPVPRSAVMICRSYAVTYSWKYPKKNFEIVGPSGIGKSMMTKMVSYILGLPLLVFNGDPDMTKSDVMDMYVPDTGDSRGAGLAKTVSASDIVIDPEGAWEKLTGTAKPGVTEDEVMACRDSLLTGSGESGRFIHVLSNYAKALIHGYICEFAEASRIRSQEVLAYLNQCAEPGDCIPMMDGSLFRRHPRAMVIFTDNMGLDSCRDIEGSALRRMKSKFVERDLEKEDLIRRVTENTGFRDSELMDRMYSIWQKTRTFCRENGMTSGCVESDELQNWVTDVMVFGEENLAYTWEINVANKAVNTSDTREPLDELIAAMAPEFV